jgi:pimeloyl-ACP methyl ester carboxylesterase
MKARILFRFCFLLLCILFVYPLYALPSFAPDSQETVQADKAYYAIEINGTVCGYTEATEENIVLDGRDLVQQRTNVFIMLSLLGSEFNSETVITSLLDPKTRKSYSMNIQVDQGPTKRSFTIQIKDNIALVKSSMSSEERTIELSPDVLVGGDQTFVEVRKEFLENNANQVSYDILEAVEQEVQNSTFKRIGEEAIELAGKSYDTVVIEQTNNKTGMKIKYWITPDVDYYVKLEVMNRKVYLTDHTVVDRIKVANMDESIFTTTNVSIADVHAISYMKLEVEIAPTGVILSSDDLNGPGQKFTGSVTDHLINGIMEIETIRYNGDNAPPFPPQFQGDEKLHPYLKPDNFIQSDDPVLMAKAREITEGSEDAWMAATRLSKWVAENISYAIPGGGDARTTFDLRAGECGAHSMLLAAFCRAVGVPARVVWGAMYAPNKGGGFGQHAWNEIYMGDDGWIPVDATAFEIDFADAGHIRIAELQSTSTAFNGKKIEVLDYKLEGKTTAKSVAAAESFEPYLGMYTIPDGSRTFEVTEKEGNLTLVIPNQAILPFNPKDERGRWICKLAPRVYMTFHENENSKADAMTLHEIVSMQKKSSPDTISESMPQEFVPYLGNYFFAAVNAEFSVSFLDSSLAVYDPLKKATVRLQRPDENGGWMDEFNKNTAYFEKDGDGKIVAMKIDAATTFQRDELAANTSVENIAFQCGQFNISGELRIPKDDGKHPLVIMVHGDGAAYRSYFYKVKQSFLRAGYAVLIWDKPGCGESTGEFSKGRKLQERADILIAAVDEMKRHPRIDSTRIGVWGISQAGYVIPMALEKNLDPAFMILVGVPGQNGIDQTAYFVGRQVFFEGFTDEQAEEAQQLVKNVSGAKTYAEYMKYGKILLDKYPIVKDLDYMAGVLPEEEWKPEDSNGDAYYDPIAVMKHTKIPTLVFLGEKDRHVDPMQSVKAYKKALKEAGNPNFEVALISGADHDIILCDTGSEKERRVRTGEQWSNYAPEYLQKLEEWLQQISESQLN